MDFEHIEIDRHGRIVWKKDNKKEIIITDKEDEPLYTPITPEDEEEFYWDLNKDNAFRHWESE